MIRMRWITQDISSIQVKCDAKLKPATTSHTQTREKQVKDCVKDSGSDRLHCVWMSVSDLNVQLPLIVTQI